MWWWAPTVQTTAGARPTRTRNSPWVTFVLARYSSASCAARPDSRSPECHGLWRIHARDGWTGRPAASGKRFRASHPIQSAPATTPGTRPDHGPCGNKRSERCGRRNRSCRPANRDKECSARPSWTAGYRKADARFKLPAGATFSQLRLPKSVAYLIHIALPGAVPQDERRCGPRGQPAALVVAVEPAGLREIAPGALAIVIPCPG